MFYLETCCCGRDDRNRDLPSLAAPSMETYWAIVEKATEERLNGEIQMLEKQISEKNKQAETETEPLMEPQESAGKEERDKKAFFDSVNKQLKPVIEGLFRNYDITEASELTRQQASDLFSNFMETQESSFQAIMVHQQFQGQKLVALKQQVKGEDTNGVNLDTKTSLAQLQEEAQTKAKEVIQTYKTQKADRDTAAFEILDSRRVGTFTSEDLVDGLSIGTQKFTDFNHALGFQLDFIEVKNNEDCVVM